MDSHLLEREADLEVLLAAVAEAKGGRSSAVLVIGEAGIGKTSLLRAFRASVGEQTHLLVGACDDLLTPRTLGPFRDAVAGQAGPLADALTDEPNRESVYRALVQELSRTDRPTVLIVEDVHWADDATLDALRYLIRRLDQLRVALVLSYRDEEIGSDHPLRQLLGAMATEPVKRLELHRLSRRAVGRLLGSDGAGLERVFAITRGNPFFVTEALACPDEEVPATVVDAVMARIRKLSPATRDEVEQLSVIPSYVEPWLSEGLASDAAALDQAERHGILESRADGLAFRHELARRAVQVSMSASRQAMLHRRVVQVLRARVPVDLPRVVHHAAAARDVETLLAFGPAAARQAAQMGAHRQALTHYELVIRHIGALPVAEQARLRTEYSWQLYAAQRWDEAIEVAHRAVALWEQVGDQVALGEALVVLSRSCFMASRPVEAAESVERAFSVLAPTGHPSLAYAQCYLGAILALTDRQEEALERLAEALRLAERGGRPDLVALALNYVGCARVDLGDLAGLDDLRSSLAMALALPHHEYAARAYTNLGEVTFQLRRYDELERCIADGTSFAGDHDLPGHAYNLEAHRAMLLMARGQWDAAETRLRRLVSAVPDPGELARLTLPALGRLLARRGDAGAAAILDRAWSLAQRNDTLAALAPAGLARLEWAWLSGEVDRAGDAIEILLARTATRAGARRRGELLRYLGRAGLTTEPFPECPPEWATGVSGDWRAAAEGWERIGDPYERALDLADSGAILPTMQALDILDRLGAVASARLVRTRLRDLGVARVPRGRQRATRKNPGGLTDRQVDVLVLVAEGLTNTEIASRLILSTRTVDHHVSAILTGLGATSRREAARRARDLGLAPGHSTASV